jgi:hypothetical protein
LRCALACGSEEWILCPAYGTTPQPSIPLRKLRVISG